MRTLTGSGLLTTMTLGQVEELESIFAVLTDDGWALPEAIVQLRAVIEGEEIEVTTTKGD